MTFTANVVIPDSMCMYMDDKGMEKYVKSIFQNKFIDEAMKNMTLTKQPDPINAQTVYTGALNIGSVYATKNTITGASAQGDVQLNLRVVEYTKGGKVSRVELQHFDGASWYKIPRIQIEL